MPNTPTVTANISCYGFGDCIWSFIEQEIATQRSGEHFITYAVENARAAGQIFRVHTARGAYLSGGSAEELIAAGRYIAHHPRYS